LQFKRHIPGQAGLPGWGATGLGQEQSAQAEFPGLSVDDELNLQLWRRLMQAVVYEKYGTPDVLELKQVDKPAPGDGEVLLKVYAASINSWDWDMLTGTPYEYRFFSGLLKPAKTNILGCDIAGRVEQAGNNVQQLKPGDEVYGDLSGGSWGGFAEYVCARESELMLKPFNMSFAEAAATPQAALLALQAFQVAKNLKQGAHVLINGGCGGVGSFAIQMAKAFRYKITD